MNVQYLWRWAAVGTVPLVVALVAVALVLTWGDGSTPPPEADTATHTGAPAAAAETEPPAAEPSPSSAPLAQVVIPKAGVTAPVVVKGLDRAGVMQSPDGPWEVAWYDFSARPGTGGNAVFSGHVDYVGVGKAVFGDLHTLEPGDAVEVRLADGTAYRYRVTTKEVFDADTAPLQRIVGPTARETVTLITCTGSFNRGAGEYDRRLVVWAEREPAGRS